MNRQVKGVRFDLGLKYTPLTNGANDIHSISIFGFGMEGGKLKFEFSHSVDGSGNSFVPRLKVKGKAELSDGWNDVPEGGNSAFRFFTVEVVLP
jgi:hypothetical protein